MGKIARGLPEAFDINVPAELGDYLDESRPMAAVAQAAAKREPLRVNPEVLPSALSVAGNVAQQQAVDLSSSNVIPRVPSPSEPLPVAIPTMHHEKIVAMPSREERAERKQRLVPIRCQINFDADTKRMFDDLISRVQQYTGQADASMGEVFEGLVRALYEARDSIDLSSVPRRGAWGSVTSRAFPVALGQAFEKAIADTYQKKSRMKIA